MNLVGQQLGRYALDSEIGHGGMSIVYRAHDTELHRAVAVKVMHSFLAEQCEAKERFQREAVAVARLKHPQIIEIFDYSGQDAPLSYIVQELVVGTSLANHLRAHPLSEPELALVLIRPIASALVHAHENGVIHRDLKPENILVGDDGALKLTDFGIARMLDSQTLTITGTLLGSPAYMAPEYIEGYATDERADIFSLGVMLYLFSVGELPFVATSTHALLKKIAAGEYTPAAQARPEIPARLSEIIDKCLARMPEHRFTSARTLVTEIDEELDSLGLDAETWFPKLMAPRREAHHEGDDSEPQIRNDASNDQDGGKPELGIRHMLVESYLRRTKAHIRAKAIGRALQDLDRLLSLAPDRPEVGSLLRRVTQRNHLLRGARIGAFVLASCVFLFGLVAAALALRGGEPKAETSPSTIDTAQTRVDPTPLRDVSFMVQGRGDLYVDQKLVQQKMAGSFSTRLPSGSHRARLRGAERDDETEFEVPTEGVVAVVRLDVRPRAPTRAAAKPSPPAVVPAQEKQSVRVENTQIRRVTFKPAYVWVNVFVDGAKEAALRNQMGAFDLELTYGRHEIRFENPNFKSEVVEVNVNEVSPPEAVVVRLRPLDARLLVQGAPVGSIIEVRTLHNNEPIKVQPIYENTREEPIFIPLTSGKPIQRCIVLVRTPKGREQEKVIEFRARGTQEMHIAL